jgi:hypothetical protein
MAKRANKTRADRSEKSPSPPASSPKKAQGPKKANSKAKSEKIKTATSHRRTRSSSTAVENVATAPLSSSPLAWNAFRDEVAAQRQRLLARDVFPEQQELSELLETLAAAYSLLASRETLAPELAKAVVSQLSQQRGAYHPQKEDAAPTDNLLAALVSADDGALPNGEGEDSVHPQSESSDGSTADDEEPAWLHADPVLTALRDVELPLTLAAANVESIGGAHPLDVRHAAGNTWHELIYRYLDGEGMIHGRWLDVLPDLMASWSRCELLAKTQGGSLLGTTDRKQCEQLFAKLVAWCRDDGSLRLSDEMSRNWDWAKTAHQVFGGSSLFPGQPEDRKPTQKGKAAKSQPKSKASPAGSGAHYSEWSKTALLSAAGDTAKLATCFAQAAMRLEFVARGKMWLQGAPRTTLVFDGEPVVASETWDEVCWHEDEDAVYLELQQDLGAHGKMQRQLLLAPKDRFLLISDAVLANRSHEIEYAAHWPLAGEIDFTTAEKTREALLASGTERVSVLPLAEPEWRSQFSPSELVSSDGSITFRRKATGAALYAPLWFDFDSSRTKKPLTWRRLTVAEGMDVVPLDVAAGYRVQTGDEQFLIYRSLAARGNRTLLGKNLVSEYLVARFARTGATEAILEIE